MNIAKKQILLVFSIIAFLSANAFCLENIGVQSPVTSPTVPQSAIQNSQVPARVESSYDYGGYGNDIVTGNVGGGKHFRGFVPYNSVSDFGGSLGSADLDSFIRRSAGNPYSSQASGVNQPYYLPSRTVSSFRRGQTSGLEQPQITFSGGTGDYAVKPLSQIEIERQ
ncbi:MAG: hypothetical protein JW912_04170, partial [Sedimentisphaerales bacterium]|nr:hypothetical protein [Sedimentisphaerales bacterium]